MSKLARAIAQSSRDLFRAQMNWNKLLQLQSALIDGPLGQTTSCLDSEAITIQPVRGLTINDVVIRIHIPKDELIYVRNELQRVLEVQFKPVAQVAYHPYLKVGGTSNEKGLKLAALWGVGDAIFLYEAPGVKDD